MSSRYKRCPVFLLFAGRDDKHAASKEVEYRLIVFDIEGNVRPGKVLDNVGNIKTESLADIIKKIRPSKV